MTESFYDAFAGHEAPQYEISSKPFESRSKDTPHANRDNLSAPYASSFNEKASNAPTEKQQNTNASVEWWKFFTKQQTRCEIAGKINGSFNKSLITNYAESKAKYVEMYNGFVK